MPLRLLGLGLRLRLRLRLPRRDARDHRLDVLSGDDGAAPALVHQLAQLARAGPRQLDS